MSSIRVHHPSRTAAQTGRPSRQALLWTGAAYVAMILAAIFALYIICKHGQSLSAPAAIKSALPEATSGKPQELVHVLIALTAVILTGLMLARVFRFFGQPPVIGEVLAGIALGPSLLGPHISAYILPPSAAPYLGVIAQLGIVLYMFIVGLELRGDLIKDRAHTAVATSHASILAPFLLGAVLALYLYPRLSTSDVPFTSFALFIGVAMSVTAFPVLARILTDRDMATTEIGVIALGCAATDDATAWCLLAFVVGVAKAEIGEGISVAVKTLAFILFMIVVVRPLLRKMIARWGAFPLPRGSVALVFVGLLLSALTTEYIGIHAIFGAFLLGAIIPPESAVAQTFSRQHVPIVTSLLLPAFFAFTGMRTRIDLVHGMDQWVICGLILLLATAGKFGGTFLAARFTGMDWRNASILGALMNTRGLMELIVLNIGLDMKVISPTLFAMMVIMALVTTMLTSPVVELLQKKSRLASHEVGGSAPN